MSYKLDLYNVLIKQRKLWVTIFSSIIGLVMAYLFREGDDVFRDWTFYQAGVLGVYMGGNAMSKFAEKKPIENE